MTTIKVGASIKLPFTITDPLTNLPIDPATILVNVTGPNGVRRRLFTYSVDVEFVRESAGHYVVWFTGVNEVGIWTYGVNASSGFAAIACNTFTAEDCALVWTP